jgi:hypothetical protein
MNIKVKIALFTVVALMAGSMPALSQQRMSGWVWFPEEATPFAYSVNEAGWLYLPETATPIWFYNFGTSQWLSEGPVKWVWIQYPFMYVADGGVWAYVLVPPEGAWVYHFGAGTWEKLTR